MAKKFNTREIVIADPKKSSIDMSASLKGTGKLGRLIPVFSQELMPNSTIDYTPNTLARFVPLAAPLMSNMTIRHHVIKVPMRQLYANWETFITGGEFNTDDSSLDSFTISQLTNMWSQVFQIGPSLNYISGKDPSSVVNLVKSNIAKATNYGYKSVLDQMTNAQVQAAEKYIVDNGDSWTPELADMINQIQLTLMNMFLGAGSLLDYFGYPVRDWKVLYDRHIGNSLKINSTSDTNVPFRFFNPIDSAQGALHIINDFSTNFDTETQFNTTMLRAYYRAWYYYFRDENLDIIPTGYTPEELKSKTFSQLYNSGNKSYCEKLIFTLFMLRPVCWAKDLFNTSTLQAYENNAYCPVLAGNEVVELKKTKVYDAKNKTWSEMELPLGTMNQVFGTDWVQQNLDGMTATSPGITGFSLKNLQKIEALSKYLDRALYGGWTYADSLSNYWGIRYSDARMQLPEYEFGTKQMVDCQTLTNNTTTELQAAGDQAAYAQGITANDGGRIFAEEHCVLIDFMSILPELSYKYSTPTHHIRLKKFDFANPLFAQLGCDVIPAVVVSNSVGKATTKRSWNLKGFGYADRYYDYKNNVNRLTGKMVDALPLYSFTQDYQAKGILKGTFESDMVQMPALSAEYVHCVPSTDCFVSDSNEYEFVYDHQASVRANIPLPVVQFV